MVNINNTEVNVDISSIVTNDTLDESLASGSMVIPFTTQNTPYARFSEVDIDGLLYVIAEDVVTKVKKGASPLYRHEISLIEPTKILQKRVIPNVTVTQPQGDVSGNIYTIHKNINNYVNNTLETLTLVETSPTQDNAVIDGLTLKNTNQYNIFINYNIRADQVYDPQAPDDYLDIELVTKYGTTVIDTQTIRIDNNTTKIGAYTIDYTPSSEQSISMTARTIGKHYSQGEVDDLALINELSILISQPTEDTQKIYLPEVVDKLLSFHPTFTLSETTRTKIAQVKSPEFTFQNYTLYEALKEVANYVNAIVYLGEDDFTTVYFYFYDTTDTSTPNETDKSLHEYLDGFADGLEINAPNVIRDDDQLYAIQEPADSSGYLTVRANSEAPATQVDDTNAVVRLQHPIYKPIKIEARGFQVELNSGAIVYGANIYHDITDYIVEVQRYNTFTSDTNIVSRGSFKNKSNTIYYTQGSNLLDGLTFQGTLPPAWNQQDEPNYAVVEAILNKIQEDNPTATIDQDLYNVSIHDLQFRVKHIPYSDVRLTVYKQKGDNIMYFNEQAPLNDMELLGRIAQENAARTGNRVTRYQGLTYDDRLLLGSKNGNEVLVNYTISRTPNVNKFTAEYAVGYANISNYVGIDSRYRQYEVPIDTIVNRRDKFTSFLQLKASGSIPTITTPSYITDNTFYDALFANYKGSPTGTRPTYAKLDFDGKVVESTIDAYRMGKTLGLAVDMYDNYSAGIKKVERDIYTGTTPATIQAQEDAQYTDVLGRVDDVTITYGNDVGAGYDADLYPDNNTTATYELFTRTYTVNKDARERYGFVWELAFQDSDDVKVYDGFVKYNRLASGLTPTVAQVRFLDEGYIPDRTLDISKTTLGIVTSQTVVSNTLKITAYPELSGTYEGFVLVINNEPILTVLLDNYVSSQPITRYIYTEEL